MSQSVDRRAFCTLALAAAVWGSRARAQQQAYDGTWSQDPTWDLLRTTRLTTDARGMVHATVPPKVEALAGKPMTVSGFILPIEATPQFKHFILSRYSPQCPFCPAGAPNEVIEVYSKTLMQAGDYMVFLTGNFAVQNNVEAGLFFRLDAAVTA